MDLQILKWESIFIDDIVASANMPNRFQNLKIAVNTLNKSKEANNKNLQTVQKHVTKQDCMSSQDYKLQETQKLSP